MPIGSHIDTIALARSREVMLPLEYYGLRQAGARTAAFSISGVAKIEQVQFVKDRMDDVLQDGWSFGKWKKAVLAGDVSLDLPAHRLENIFRTNLQGSYAAGRWRSIQRNKSIRPYLRYVAINDSRTRPAHSAMHGHVAPIDDAIWDRWTAPCGFMCRCTNISMTEAQAEKRRERDIKHLTDPARANARANALKGGPDAGWDYHPGKETTEGIKRAIKRKSDFCLETFSAFADSPDKALWCKYDRLKEALSDYKETLNNWNDRAALLRDAIGAKAYAGHRRATQNAAITHGLTEEQAVAIRFYTDPDAAKMLNTLTREITHTGPVSLAGGDLYRAGIAILVLDAALEAMPATTGVYFRGMDTTFSAAFSKRFWEKHTKKHTINQYDAFTSAMLEPDKAYGGDAQFIIYSTSARDLEPFSIKKDREVLIPRNSQFQVNRSKDGIITIKELEQGKMKTLPNDQRFSKGKVEQIEPEDDIDQMLLDNADEYERKLNEAKKRGPDPKLQHLYDRCQAEIEAGQHYD